MNLKDTLNKHNFKFKKKFGQNFITDGNLLQKIVDAGEVGPDDVVIEVGPGAATLTKALAQHAKAVIAIEIDTDLIPIIEETMEGFDNFYLAQGDALEWVQWQIAYSGEPENALLDTGKIYGTAELRADFDGFMAGTSYMIKCTIQTVKGAQATTDWVNFSVDYPIATVDGTATACASREHDAVRVNIPAALSADSRVNGIAVYRQKNGEGVLEHLCDLKKNAEYFLDFSACSQQRYAYHLYGMTGSAYETASAATDDIAPCFWNWTLIACTQDEKGVYHAKEEYRFALDVNSGAVSNNNEPEIKKNFTPYPVRQRGNANYRSGTLTAYIGKARNGQYVDSVELMEALNALSTSKMTKFLKTRKGEILRVETSAPISMQVGDKYAAQPAKITLPWVEVGSAKGASIILTENETLTMTN